MLEAVHADDLRAVGHLRRGVDLRVVGVGPPLVSECLILPPLARGVEVFESEAERIDLVVAAGALLELAVDFEPLPDGRLVDAGHLGCDLAGIGHRQAGIGAEKRLEDPCAALHGRRPCAVGRERENRRLRHDAPA